MDSRVPISKSLLIINSTSSILARLVNVTVLVWATQFLLKQISPGEYALLAIVTAIMALLPLLTTFLTGGLSRYVTEAYAKDDQLRVTQITSTMFPILLGGGVFLVAVGTAFTWRMATFLTIDPTRLDDARLMFGLLLASAVVRLLLAPFNVGLLVRQKFVWQNLIFFGGSVLKAVLLLVLLSHEPKVKWVVVSQVVSNAAVVVATTTLSCRLIPALRFRASCVDLANVWEILRFNGWAFVSYVSDTVRKVGNPLILNELANAVEVTCFDLASRVDSEIRTTTMVASVPLNPVLTGMHATGQKQRLANTYLRGGRLALWATLFLAVPLIVYRNEILRIYLDHKFAEFQAAATVLLLLLTTYALSYPSVLLSRISIATANLGPFVRRRFLAQLCNLTLAIYLISKCAMGAIGCALATLIIALVFQPTVFWPLGLRLMKIPRVRFVRETLVPGLMPALVAVSINEGIRLLVQPHYWLPVGGCVMLGMLVYVAVLAVFCLTPTDRHDLGAMKKRLMAYK